MSSLENFTRVLEDRRKQVTSDLTWLRTDLPHVPKLQCDDLKALCREMTCLETAQLEFMKALESTRTSLETTVLSRTNAYLPISSLPPELLSHIFSLCVFSSFAAPSFVPCSKTKSLLQSSQCLRSTRTRIQSVCRLWRSVVTQSSILWNTIMISNIALPWYGAYCPKDPRLVPLEIERAAGRRIDLRMSLAGERHHWEQLAETMGAVVPKCGSVYFGLPVLPQTWALLDRLWASEIGDLKRLMLSISSCDPAVSVLGPGCTVVPLDRTPKLEDFWLAYPDDSPSRRSSLRLKLLAPTQIPSLTRLCLRGDNVDWLTATSLVSACPNLITLDWRIEQVPYMALSEPEEIPTPTTLEHLRHLSLSGSAVLEWCARHLLTPNIERLRIGIASPSLPSIHDSILSLSDEFPNLRHLEVVQSTPAPPASSLDSTSHHDIKAPYCFFATLGRFLASHADGLECVVLGCQLEQPLIEVLQREWFSPIHPTCSYHPAPKKKLVLQGAALASSHSPHRGLVGLFAGWNSVDPTPETTALMNPDGMGGSSSVSVTLRIPPRSGDYWNMPDEFNWVVRDFPHFLFEREKNEGDCFWEWGHQ